MLGGLLNQLSGDSGLEGVNYLITSGLQLNGKGLLINVQEPEIVKHRVSSRQTFKPVHGQEHIV